MEIVRIEEKGGQGVRRVNFLLVIVIPFAGVDKPGGHSG
jgi:hypothetical protein